MSAAKEQDQKKKKKDNRYPLREELVDQLTNIQKQISKARKFAEQGADIQTLILSKERFDTLDAARSWIQQNGFSDEKVDETDNTYRFRQFSPDDCTGNFDTFELTDGVMAVRCNVSGGNESKESYCGSPLRDEDEFPSAQRLDPTFVDLRDHEDDRMMCGKCRYFDEPDVCRIVASPIHANLVCDAFDGYGYYGEIPVVAIDQWDDFISGLMQFQPMHKTVIGGAMTPRGPIVLVEDSRGRRFSMDRCAFLGTMAHEFLYEQKDVDQAIGIGKQSQGRIGDETFSAEEFVGPMTESLRVATSSHDDNFIDWRESFNQCKSSLARAGFTKLKESDRKEAAEYMRSIGLTIAATAAESF